MKACRYVAFLRGVNVGGRVVKMAVLKKLFEAMTCEGVETFIASGNVIFDAPAGAAVRPAARLETQIEARLEAALGYAVAAFLRTLPELAAIAAHNPFAGEPAGSGARLYIAFLRAAPSAARRRALLGYASELDQLQVRQREVYWLNRRPPGDTRVPAPPIERVLEAQATVRNANTVRKLSTKYAAG